MLSLQDKTRIFRARFFGRQDVFARRWESRRADGTTAAGFAPVCASLWKDGCHLRLKDGVLCDSCQIKEYVPVSDETTAKHLQNEEQHVIYCLLPDGKIMFGAIDFDLKAGKEHLGYDYSSVVLAQNILREWGVPHGVARSTGEGFHLYIFFTEPYSASRFRAVIIELYERAGFMEFMRQGQKSLPECFPKQSYVGNSGVGNGIKPPMIMPRWEAGRNGFIDDGGNFISPDQQWQYLESIPRATPEMFDGLIEKYEIPVYEDTAPAGTTYAGAPTNGERKIQGSWRPPLAGSIEKTLHACAAFRKIRDKSLAGEVLGHQEGFALYRLAMGVAGGLDWFKTNVRGWGDDAGQMRQLTHSLAKNYGADTCRKLQENGVCVPGTKCLTKRPPRETVEGRLVARTDIPENQWPEPSPIRYAFGPGDDFLEQLMAETAALKDEKDPEKLMAALGVLFTRVQVFDDEQQKAYKTYVKGLKLIKPGEFSKLYTKAANAAQKELEKNAGARSDMIYTHGNWYRKNTPFGYMSSKISRSGPPKDTPLCMVDINVQEERTYIDDGRVVQTVFKGRCSGPGVDKEFEIGHDKWIENADFCKYFLAVLGNAFNIQRPCVDAIRQAAMSFSQQAGISKSSHLITQGWYDQTYLMPTVLVDKDGVRPNTEQQVTLTGKEHAKHLDFSILSDSEFSETMLGIKKDLLCAWPRFWMMFGLSHTLMPAVLRPLGLNKKRCTLFFEGLTGTGKTEITHILQQFWGDFPAPLNMISSSKGIMEEAYHFKDCILVVDDYKGINKQQTDALKAVIQYSYDGSTAAKQNRDCTQQKSKMARATLMMSGEHFLESEASAVARTILLEVDKYSTVKTREAYTNSWAMAKNYKGITPRFIHWFLNQDLKAARELVDKYHADLQARSAGKQNAARIALNLSLNYLVWNLWVQFMLDSNVIDRKESEDLLAEHWSYILKIQTSMQGRCEDEQSAVVFMRFLRELIASKEVSIGGLDGYYNERKQLVGFVSVGTPDTVNFFPDTTLSTVRISARDTGIAGNERSIARQLADMGILNNTDPSRLKKLVRYGNSRQRVWPIKMEELGFEVRPETKATAQVIPINGNGPQMDENGIF